MGSVDHPGMLKHLLSENARLKALAAQPEHERILQDVLLTQLQRFFSDARQSVEDTVDKTSTPCSERSERREGAAGEESGVQRFSALVETLCILGTQNEELQRHMSDMQTKTVAALNEKVEALESERGSLKRRVEELEREVAAKGTTNTADEELTPPLMAELRSLRTSEELLRQQLQNIHERGEAAVAESEKLAKDGIRATMLLPRLLESVEEVRGALKVVESERDVLRLQLQELKERQSVQHTLCEAQLREQVALSQSSVQHLLSRISVLETREAQARDEVAACMQTIERQQGIIQNLQACQGVAVETLASKRRRLESEIFDNPDSVRRDLVAFWCEGREELEQLREEVQKLRSKVQQLKPLKEKLGQLERNRSAVATRIVDLADEVSRVREENQKLRVQYSGLEVERDYLRGSLAAVISQHMQEEELSSCCAAVREAAARSAASSVSAVVDPQVIQQTMRQARELQSEVAQLGKQKEKLHRCISLREKRLAALVAREAVQCPAAAAQEARPAVENSSVVHTVSWAEAHAVDVLSSLEEGVATESGLQRQGVLVAMQTRLDAAEQEIAVCKQQLEASDTAREEAEARYWAARAELQATLSARETAMTEMHHTNTVLLQSVEKLRSEQKQLRQSYYDLAAFTENLASALEVMLLFVQGETNLAASAGRLLLQHRSEICELTQQAADGWEMRRDDVQRVVESIDRMCEYVRQSTEQNQREQALNSVTHLRRLTDAVKQQEGRLKEMQKNFTEVCQKLGESLATRVAEAQQQAEGLWKKRLGMLQEERHRLQGQLKAEKDLLSRMECLMIPGAMTQPTLTAAEATVAHAVINPTTDAPELPDQERNEVVDVINRLLAAVSQPATTEEDVPNPLLLPAGQCKRGGSGECEAELVEEEGQGGERGERDVLETVSGITKV